MTTKPAPSTIMALWVLALLAFLASLAVASPISPNIADATYNDILEPLDDPINNYARAVDEPFAAIDGSYVNGGGPSMSITSESEPTTDLATIPTTPLGSLPSSPMSDPLETTQTFATRAVHARHDYALVCYDRQGEFDRNMYNHCTTSQTGYYCDSEGNKQWMYRSNWDCFLWCECEITPANSMMYCILHMLSMVCQDMGYPNGAKKEVSYEELEKGVNNGTYSLPSNTTLANLRPVNTTTTGANSAEPLAIRGVEIKHHY